MPLPAKPEWIGYPNIVPTSSASQATGAEPECAGLLARCRVARSRHFAWS